ncbi:MAG: OmpA family protein [Chitinophagales bacterium]
MRKFTVLLITLFLCSNLGNLKAQILPDTTNWYLDELPAFMQPDSNKIKKRKLDQHRDYINMEYPYPAKPRHWSTLSITGGSMMTSGDVKARMGWNVGLNYRWNLGYIVSMRVDLHHGRSYGQNYEAKDLVGSLEENQLTNIHNQAYAGNTGGVNYANSGEYLAFDNYKNEITDASVSLMFHLNNIKYHREKTFFNFYTFLGIGGMLYKTWVDALDENGNVYEYNNFLKGDTENDGVLNVNNQELADVFADGVVSAGERGTVRDALQDLYGGKALKRSYETAAEGHKNEENFLERVFNPTFHVGAAVDFLVHPRITIGIETKQTFTNDDLVDGQRWTVQGDLTRDYDTYNQTNITLGFNIGKKKEKSELPMWWMNPNDRTMFMLQQQPDVAKVVREAIPNDEDGDGVPDKQDKEPNTPADAIVNSKGETLDSDGDGCPDHEDPEPFSTPILPIVDCKNVYDFATKECCDEKATVIAAVPCKEIQLPSIHFDDNKYYVKPEFYAHLHEVARKMQDCPDLKVVSNGHTDTRADIKYNEQLSWNRVNASINYLVQKYGISRDRFIVKYSGERSPLTGDETAAGKYQNRRVEFRFAEDGEEGESNPPAPHPGIKAGSDK